MMRVGFILSDLGEAWIGGTNYFINLLSALVSQNDLRVEPIIFVGKHTNMENFKGFPEVSMLKTPLLDYGGGWRFLRWVPMFLLRPWFIERLLKENGVSVLSHSGYMGPRFKIPTIGWIPDFQHRHLPEFFGAYEISMRDISHRSTCKRSSIVIVSSNDALKDLSEFVPEYKSKARVLNFVSGITRCDNIPGIEDIEKTYGFKGPFFYVPNQFWAHKNHIAALEALKILNASGKDVLVLATGNTNDHRQPGHFKSLQSYVETNGLKNNFRVLGLIPRADVAALMRNCVAFINPSFFEGWSTTVEEAKSIGKRIILSDIAVHREQAPPGGVFFDPKNHGQLAEIMWDVWIKRDPDADERLMTEAAEALPGRIREFSLRYQDIVLEAAGMTMNA